MTTLNIYDIVVETLTQKPDTRDSDKKLIWEIYKSLGHVRPMTPRIIRPVFYVLKHEDFLVGPSFESITRARRKAQELNPALRAVNQVTTGRASKATTKGNFIFTEEVRQ